jgi:hypothetical protein
LPYRATKAKPNANADFSPQYSDPFTEDEFIAIRDEPAGPFYVARVMQVTPKTLQVHYYGCTEVILASAIFKPCWHDAMGECITLPMDCPETDDYHPNGEFIEYSGIIDLQDIHTVLVARKLEFTKASKLRFRSLRALAPFHDQLFRYEK